MIISVLNKRQQSEFTALVVIIIQNAVESKGFGGKVTDAGSIISVDIREENKSEDLSDKNIDAFVKS